MTRRMGLCDRGARTCPRRAFWLGLTAVMALASLAGCERQVRDMYAQPRLDPGEASTLFPDGKGNRPPPPGSVAHAMGDLAATSSGRRGKDEPAQRDAAFAAMHPPPVTRALLLRGGERFSIYCLPCHGPLGDGNGPITLRGFPHPPTFHLPRLREAPDRHFLDVITQGYGVMVSYADRVEPQDRWAIVAYLRALQLSQHAAVADLPPELVQRLGAVRAPAPPGGAASVASPVSPARSAVPPGAAHEKPNSGGDR